jgi:hypothetical protein
MPFFPMRPATGRAIRGFSAVDALWDEVSTEKHWIPQPKLNGDRACLAVIERRVFIQNRKGGWYRFRARNAKDFLKLPDGMCFDGEVFKGNFYPFELLAIEHRSLLLTTTHERIVLAKEFVDKLGHPWMYPHPTKNWLMRRNANLPDYEGVVLKTASAPYIVLGSTTQSSLLWLKRTWK